MKKTILTSLVAVCLLQPVSAVTMIEYCESYTELSAAIMFARQSGVSVMEVAKIVGEDPLGPATIKAAFLNPIYKSEKSKINAVELFAEEMALICIGQGE